MADTEEKFEITLNNVTMNVERLQLAGHIAFRVIFSSARKPLVLARAINADKDKFWTSIPEGRQKEAEGMGALIENYFKNKK